MNEKRLFLCYQKRKINFDFLILNCHLEKKKFLNISRLENTAEFKRIFLDMRDLYLANELHKACRPIVGNLSKAESLLHLN